jgi:hypothetical protein
MWMRHVTPKNTFNNIIDIGIIVLTSVPSFLCLSLSLLTSIARSAHQAIASLDLATTTSSKHKSSSPHHIQYGSPLLLASFDPRRRPPRSP